MLRPIKTFLHERRVVGIFSRLGPASRKTGSRTMVKYLASTDRPRKNAEIAVEPERAVKRKQAARRKNRAMGSPCPELANSLITNGFHA